MKLRNFYKWAIQNWLFWSHLQKENVSVLQLDKVIPCYDGSVTSCFRLKKLFFPGLQKSGSSFAKTLVDEYVHNLVKDKKTLIILQPYKGNICEVPTYI